MKFALFYLTSQEGLEPVYHPIYLGGAVVYVRAEVVEAPDLSAAFDLAKPQPHESVMNAHPYPEPTEAQLLTRSVEDIKAGRIKALEQLDREIA